MKKRVSAILALGALVAATSAAQAADGPLLVRARVLQLDPDNGNSPAAGVELNSKVIPEVDISYFFTKNFALELVLTVPQKHDVKLNGAKIGTLQHLPPSLMAQYHFTPDSTFSPYLGAGLNMTRIFKVELPAGVDVERSSYGLAVQAGFDYKIDKNWYVNADFKYIDIKADVTAGGSKLTELKVSPFLFGIGVGYRF